ncbi:hypothetical protein K1719_040887 [Acacia pycnantha]|nr:hypothetical protein K1719_040887 [Acacia pycnantha]
MDESTARSQRNSPESRWKRLQDQNAVCCILAILGSTRDLVWLVAANLRVQVSLRCCSFLCCVESLSEIEALMAFRLGLHDPIGSLDGWDASTPSAPSDWPGIFCYNNQVIELRLPRLQLAGDKRSSPDYDHEDYDGDPFAHKKAKLKAEEASPGVTIVMFLRY